ncbi:MAG: UvrB/UvrC motif-containing protein [Sedimentisphaerales bacterium]|nr:UvrB/UvrC motif-containing protein [Sedimentisphaerales bacterium]
MQCQICKKNEATIHLTEISDGQRSEMHLCEACAAEQGIAVKTNVPLNDLLSSLLESQPSDEQLYGASERKIKCPNCGMTLKQYRKDSLLGCPYDYVVFEKQLLPLIKMAHNGKTVHCGKIPAKAPQDIKNQVEIFRLQRELNQAVKAEDYERAAKLRDTINQQSKK